MPSYISDTHTLVWHLSGSSSLSPKVRQVLETADKGESSVFVPTIVVVEMVYLAERVKINPDILKRTFELLQDPKGSYRPVPLDLAVPRALASVPRASVPDLPDRVIAATAIVLGLPVLTVDSRLRGFPGIQTLW
jgi:PIN domain nuclease of toxin-antitoxin system